VNRRALLVAGVVVVAAGAFVFLFRPADSTSVGTARIGAKAPTFSTFDLDGRRVRLAEVDGPVLVNFWASWCIPCRDEFPMLARVQDGDSGVKVLGVIFRDSAENARSFMREQRAGWPGLLDPRSQIADAYDVHPKPGIPVTFAIDGAGIVRAKHLGPLTAADLDKLLALIR
jgi:cytochrome c biogenesis protein CcmG/thiol:disulfide interchange protein DsbE